LNGEASSSGRNSGGGGGGGGATQWQDDDRVPTELIIQLEKFGSGWGEEILPRASIVRRPIEKKQRDRNRSTRPDPWTVRLPSGL
jgi:hypothetical protein